jgi:hypothetical protein
MTASDMAQHHVEIAEKLLDRIKIEKRLRARWTSRTPTTRQWPHHRRRWRCTTSARPMLASDRDACSTFAERSLSRPGAAPERREACV